MSMQIGMHQIAVNTASLPDGSSIAAYLTSAAGTLLTHTTVGAKENLDSFEISSHLQGSAYAAGTDYLSSMGVVDNAGNWVPFTLNAAGELPVAATVNFAGDYAEDSAHASGDIGLFQLAVRRDARSSGVDADGDYSSFNVNAVGELWVKDADALAQLVLANSSLDAIEASVASIDVDTSSIITELQAANASLDAIEADADEMNTSLNNIEGFFKAEDSLHASGDMGLQALAVRKDAQGSNSADGDYASLLTWSEGSLKVVDIANGTILQQQVSVTDTAAQVPAANLANRRSLMLQNTGANRLWLGSATVTTSGATAGIEMPPNSFMELEVGPAVNVYAVKVGAAGNNLNVLEIA